MKNLARELYRRLRALRARRINKLDPRVTYPRWFRRLRRAHGAEAALKLAVGGEFEAMGLLELETLKYFGLREDAYLVDVGCGSGRLAAPLSRYLKGRYLGVDIVPELIEHARRLAGRPDWRFALGDGLSIPERDEVADMVCFFSVFTHLLHEQSYVYLREAARVLKPDGTIVFSFLDFTVPRHWHAFEANVGDIGVNMLHLNMFISKDAIPVWAEHLGLEVRDIRACGERFLPLPRPVSFEDGTVMEGLGSLRQSVCALGKKR